MGRRLLSVFLFCLGTASALPSGDWLELIDTSLLPVLRENETLQVSSYDRTGGNDDGFGGTYSFLREQRDGGYVLFDEDGPGCIYRVWSANPGQRRIEFYFDGERKPRLVFDSWEDMFLGKAEPFVPPFSQHVIGGWISYVPIPYAKRLKIVARERINFYQISYQRFPEDRIVRTFTAELSATDREKMARVKTVWDKPGAAPWNWAGAEMKNEWLKVAPGSPGSLSLAGGAVLTGMKLRFESLPPTALRTLLIRVNADGGTAEVEVPFGDFFLQPFPEENVQSMLAGRDPQDGLAFYSYWPMPFRESLELAFVQGGNDALSFAVQVEHAPLPRPFEDFGYFHARWQRQHPTVPGQLFPILDMRGRGHWCGFSAAMQGYGPGHGYLEGDEMAWWDGHDNSSYNGTGSEDYYNGGWYFGTTGSFPYFGCGYLREAEGRCHAFRLHMTDPLPFQEYARIGIEHGHANAYPADYAGTTFFYAAPGAKSEPPPIPEAEARLWTPVSLPGYLEAEALAPDAPVRDAWEASGGAAIRVGVDGVSLRLALARDDIYTPYLRFLGGIAGEDVLLSVNESMSFALKPEEDTGSAITLVGEPARLSAGTHLVEVHARQGEVLLDAVRFAPSPKTPDVLEAEYLDAHPVAGARVERADVFPVGMSGHSGIAIQHHRENDGAEFVWELAEAGSYRITPRLYNDPARMPVRLTLDGVPLAPAIVCAAAELDWPAHSESRVTPRIAAGKHLLGILCAQAPAEGTDPTTFLDYFEIRPKGIYEGEHLKVIDADGAPADEQRLGGHSNGGQLWFRPGDPDAELKLAVDTAEAGRYTICGYFAMAPDYGRYRLWVNGQPAGAVFDGYAPGLKRSDEICFGSVELKRGVNSFVFRGAGKARESSSYMLGLDVLILKEE